MGWVGKWEMVDTTDATSRLTGHMTIPEPCVRCTMCEKNIFHSASKNVLFHLFSFQLRVDFSLGSFLDGLPHWSDRKLEKQRQSSRGKLREA